MRGSLDPNRILRIGSGKPGLISLSGILWLFASCSSVNPDIQRKHDFRTRYGNGSPRTEFSYLNNEIVGEIRLYDSSGNLRLKKPVEDTSISGNYFPENGVHKDSARMAGISGEMGPLIQGLTRNYRQGLYPHYTGKVEYWIWINGNGRVEHVVCRRSEWAEPSFIQSTIEDIEGWKVSPDLVGSGLLVSQKVLFVPGTHRTRLSAFVLGLAAIAVFGSLVKIR